jgi:WD40 repeat protein/serine/threonine protein kinase
MSASLCPKRSQIRELVRAQGHFLPFEELEEHLLHCPDCQAELEALDGAMAPFVSTVQRLLDPTAIQSNRIFQAALVRLSSLHPGAGDKVAGTPENQAPAVAGTLGDFRIVRELGRGGMGIVYEAEQLSLGRRVALKILPFAALLDPRQLQRFQNEARAAASLEHPNIVSVYGVGVERGVHYYAMRCIHGQNLAQVIQQLRQRSPSASPEIATKATFADPTRDDGGELTDLLSTHEPDAAAYLRAVARIGVQAAEALDYAHEHGVVHRDIKPSNLMLDQTGWLWVADFGLARIETDPTLSMSGGILGTLRYMSPEQALGKRGVVDHRSDVYSLGVTLYELLTLTPIFPEADRGTLLSRIATDEPKPPRHLNPRIPADLETIVVKAMAKHAADRYDTAGALAADLKRFLESKPILARPVGRARRILKWARRRPAVAGLVAITALAVLALLAGGWWHAATLQSALIEADAQRQAALEQTAIAQEREQRVRRFLYAGDMRQAYVAWTNSHVGETLDLLERHRPKPGEDDRRSFVWYYLWKLCHGELLTLRGHASDVHCVVFSPDGRWLATASQDHTAKLWAAATGKELVTYRGHTDEVNTVAFSPDGKTLATCSDDHTVRLWDTQSGRERATLRGHTRDVFVVAFSPDGKTVASGGLDSVVKLWDATRGKEMATLVGHARNVESMAFSPDGKTLATGSMDRSVIFWDLDAKRPRNQLSGFDNAVVALAFTHDGRLLATSIDGVGPPVKLLDVATGATKATLQGHTEGIQCLAISVDDKILAGAGKQGTLYLWDIPTGQLCRTIRGHAARIWYVAFSLDGQTLATASGDRTVKLWKVGESPAKRFVPGRAALSTSFAKAKNGNLLAFVAELKKNGKRVLPAEIWEFGETLARHPLTSFIDSHHMPKYLYKAEFAPGGRMIAAADETGAFSIFDVTTKLPRTTFATAERDRPDSQNVAGIAWSPDGRTLATANKNEPQIKLWDTATGQARAVLRRKQGDTYFVTLAFSPDGTTLAAGDMLGVLILWDLHTGAQQATPRLHQSCIYGLAFTADGKTVATASSDRTIKIWDVESLHERATLQGHATSVCSVAFSPDGKTLASGSLDGIVRLWDTSTWQDLVVLQAHKPGDRITVAFTPDGQTLVTCGSSYAAPHSPFTSELALWSAPHEQAD